MKRFLLAFMLICGAAHAETTGNLITNPTFSGTSGWSTSGMRGGNPSLGGGISGYTFSYSSGTIEQTYAINQALSNVGAGVQIQGFDYGFRYQIWCANRVGSDCVNGGTADTLSYTANITNSSGQNIYTNTQNLSGGLMASPANIDVQQRFANPYELSALGNFSISFTGQDNGYWGGNYGPTISNVYSKAVYTVDQCSVNPQSSPTCPGFKTYYNMSDDGYARVDLPFTFPFYGQLFTTSYMYTNGVVGFLNNNWGFCCDGTDLNNQTTQPNSPWNYAIYALNTDLIPGPNSEFYTQVTDNGTGLKYSWVNVPEIGTSLNNTFHVQIKDSGYIGITYDQVNLNPWRNPLIGIAGDISQGQYSMTYFGQASGLPALAGTTNTYTGTETTDICTINPLYNTSCPGYAAAYFNQQCSMNSLYDPTCPGYATAYYNYQCSINPLYHTGCPGYQQAYFDQQCSLNALYNSSCPGYDQAYFDQQCSLDGLYSQSCPNYADAYYIQQCTANALYDSGCTGYAQAYFDQQCSLNGLYDRQCPNYAQAYAAQQLLNPPVAPTTIVVQSETPALVSDPVVNDVVSTTATSASPAQAATATVPLISTPTTTTTVAVVESTPAEKKEEKTNDTSTDTSSSTTSVSSSSSSEKKDEPKTTRQALAERRLEAARAKAVEQGKNLANDMSKAATLEAQIAVQNVVLSAMSFVPGFDVYGKVTVPDGVGYKPFTVYNNQKNVDNARVMRRLSGASDVLHAEMVDSQYRR